MAVYVDSMRAGYGRMLMCHMVADRHWELMEMAAHIGVAEKWLQAAGTWKEHFDVCLSKKDLAVRSGAVEVVMKQLTERQIAKRERPELLEAYWHEKIVAAPSEGEPLR